MSGRSKLVCTAALAVACANPLVIPFASSLGVASAHAARAYLPGEAQPLVDLSSGGLAIYPAGVGQVLAQTFTPKANGWLGYLQLPVACDPGVLLNVRVREGMGGPMLYEVNVAGLQLQQGTPFGTLQLIQVFDPAVSKNGIKLRKGHEYAFELAATRDQYTASGSCAIARGPTGDSYTRGRSFFQVPDNGPDFLPLPNGAPNDDEDLPFVTLVR